MGMFNQLFGNKNSKSDQSGNELPWIPLNSRDTLDEIVGKSASRTQVIFKHSTRCGISRMALRMFESEKLGSGLAADFYFLDLLANRNVSDAVAQKFGVAHQSPQLIVIRNGEVATHTSHGDIANLPLEKYV
ncbi:bacillithiol system redox-active protein YtxJ [Zeaxanthinibacter sp. PT1]|nr:bacillithiol system redox-active protein YtxJ [Zeaxanthinibacter sp. PT1]MDC6351718.1 bacillithiol system redox-active protein YtxJ [Zeaxanthinibacter sp. PT1]